MKRYFRKKKEKNQSNKNNRRDHKHNVKNLVSHTSFGFWRFIEISFFNNYISIRCVHKYKRRKYLTYFILCIYLFFFFFNLTTITKNI